MKDDQKERRKGRRVVADVGDVVAAVGAVTEMEKDSREVKEKGVGGGGLLEGRSAKSERQREEGKRTVESSLRLQVGLEVKDEPHQLQIHHFGGNSINLIDFLLQPFPSFIIPQHS